MSRAFLAPCCLLLFVGAGCARGPVGALPNGGALVRASVVNPAWGGMEEVLCNTGDLFLKSPVGDEAYLFGTVDAAETDRWVRRLGSQPIAWSQDVRVPDAFDADHTNTFTYAPPSPAGEPRDLTEGEFRGLKNDLDALFSAQHPPVTYELKQRTTAKLVREWTWSDVLPLSGFTCKNPYDPCRPDQLLTAEQQKALTEARKWPRENDVFHTVFAKEGNVVYQVDLMDEWTQGIPVQAKPLDVKPLDSLGVQTVPSFAPQEYPVRLATLTEQQAQGTGLFLASRKGLEVQANGMEGFSTFAWEGKLAIVKVQGSVRLTSTSTLCPAKD